MSPEDEGQLEQRIAALEKQISELRQQLVHAQRMSSVGALASSITHEFNNILTTIINYAKMGLRHKDQVTREKSFDKILTAAQRASKITTGMLAYSRNRGVRMEPCDLATLVEDVLVLVEKDLQMHRIKLQTDLRDHPYANLNASQVQQVLLNLIINGRQAMKGGGQMFITVQSNTPDSMGEIAVRDTGSGIAAEKLPKIFDPFFSTKMADSQGQGGTGLGLSLCREIIEAHNGRIRVESALEQGTTFTLRFPLVAPPTKPNRANDTGSSSVAVSRVG